MTFDELKAALEELKADNTRLLAEMSAQNEPEPMVSPLAPKTARQPYPVAGVTLASAAAGVKYKGRDDVMLARIEPGATMAGVFTKSATRSAPVLWCENALAEHAASRGTDAPLAIIVNSGNANAFTGKAGEDSTRNLGEAVASLMGSDPHQVFIASTGVIGERLPDERIAGVLTSLQSALSADAWQGAAGAIMTTDTFPKLASAKAEIGGVPVAVSGFAKGSGMIAPDMATMLGFVFTDAAIPQPVLQSLLSSLNETSFNAITVDGDTSTSDTVLLAATGKAGNSEPQTVDDPKLQDFKEALSAVLTDLAHQIIRDGEGASKFIAINVTGAQSDAAAKRVGLSIANSPLVKTAFAGEDPNWGRIVMAVGKSGEAADRDRLTIRFGDILVAEEGWVAESYREEDGAAYMKAQELSVSVDLGIGAGSATVWTCDLTHRYITINADYRS